ncbi:MAG: hypothetical protein L3J13_04685 [Devosiaceae bacterium]|nr:hypothetical protein [Devosiaceae bacterium]
MKFFLAAFLALFPGLALAHPGHIAVSAGHIHPLFELAVYALVLGAAALLILFALQKKSNG